MTVQKLIAVLIILYGACYGILLMAKGMAAKTERESEKGSFKAMALAEMLVYFLSTMGFPDFVMNTLIFKRTGWVTDEKIPPSLVAVSVTPGAVIAFSYLRNGADIQVVTLLACMVTIALGSYTGAHIVTGLDGQLIRRIMTAAMLFSMAALVIKMVVTEGATGTAAGLQGLQFLIALPIVFCFGFINMFGVPMKPAATALFLLLGLSPLATLTLMLVIGFISPMSGGIKVVRSGRYHKKLSMASAVFGSLGAVLGAVFTISLNAMLLNIILLVIMGFTVITLAGKRSS